MTDRSHLDGEIAASVQSLLIVDDDATLRERLARAIRDRGYEVRTAGSYEEGLASARTDSPELAVVDLRMPGPSGLELVRDLKGIDPTIRIIVVTGYGSITTAVEAMRFGALDFVQKPADAEDILAAFERSEKAGPHNPPQADLEPLTLARAEWEHINRVLYDSGGNVSEAARRLGIHRRSLQRKLQKYPPLR
jgi:two-component system, response regulator RegA